jgi:hypothetical protein
MYGDEKIDALKPTAIDDTFSLEHPLVDLVRKLARQPAQRAIRIAGADLDQRAI